LLVLKEVVGAKGFEPSTSKAPLEARVVFQREELLET
jgi:hypothetical protein